MGMTIQIRIFSFAVKAVEENYPNSAVAFCALHMEGNLVRNLTLTLRRTKAETREIRNRILGRPGRRDGLANIEDPDVFDIEKLSLETEFPEVFEMSDYMDDFLSRVRKNIVNSACLSREGNNDILFSNKQHNNDAG